MKKEQTIQQTTQAPLDFFKQTPHYRYAGNHLLIELWQAENLDNIEMIEEAMIEATKACNATLLEVKLHHFSPYQGVSGVAIISESHISIHTWPELGYAAIDAFMCGKADPTKAIPIFKRYLKPKNIQLMEFKRGVVQDV